MQDDSLTRQKSINSSVSRALLLFDAFVVWKTSNARVVKSLSSSKSTWVLLKLSLKFVEAGKQVISISDVGSKGQSRTC